MAAYAEMEMAQNPMGRCVRTRVKSTEGRLRWLLLNRKRPQRGSQRQIDLETVSECPYDSWKPARDGRERVHMGNVR